MAFGRRPLQDRRGFLFASLLGFAGRLGLALSFAFGRLGLNLLVALLCSILVLQLVESLHFQLICILGLLVALLWHWLPCSGKGSGAGKANCAEV